MKDTQVLIGLGVAAAVGIGGAVLWSRNKAAVAPKPPPAPATPATPAVPTPGTIVTPTSYGPAAWGAAASAPMLTRVRWTMTPAAVASLVGNWTATGDDLGRALTQPWVSQLLQSTVLFAWGPQDALPTDWPADDPTTQPDGQASYHVELVYGVGYAFSMTSNPNPPALAPADLLTKGIAVTGMWIPTGVIAPATRTTTVKWLPGYKPGGASILTGDHVRLTMASVDWMAINASLGGIGDAACLNFLLLLSGGHPFADALGTTSVLAWCPGDLLPPDWPADDPSPSSDFHLEFRYGGTAPLLITSLPGPMAAWVADGIGA